MLLPAGQCGVARLTVQIKLMDFCSGQGVKRSNSSTIARLYNAALGKKTQFYVPDSVQHHTNGGVTDMLLRHVEQAIKTSMHPLA